MPLLRNGPPYLTEEMIAAEPALAERLLDRLAADGAVGSLAALVAEAVSMGDAVTTTGCGTSEHAAMAAMSLLAEAMPLAAHLVRSRQALDLLRDPQPGGLVLGVSHEGGTWATNEALSASRSAGARTALVSVSGRSPGAALADLVVETGEQDQSWCHTVGYLSPLLAAAAVAARLRGAALDATAARTLLAVGHEEEAAARGAAEALARCHRLLVVGAGIDLVSARELALKIEEAAGLPASAMHLETVRHGHLAAVDAGTGLVLIQTDAEPAGEAVRERSRAVLRSAQTLGSSVVAILGARVGAEIPLALTPSGRLASPAANRLSPLSESLLGAAIPLQLLALHLAMARGRNPDAIGRDDPRQAAAAEA